MNDTAQQEITIIKPPWDLIQLRRTGIVLMYLLFAALVIGMMVLMTSSGWLLVDLPLIVMLVYMLRLAIRAWHEIGAERLVITPMRIEYQSPDYHQSAAWSDVGFVEKVHFSPRETRLMLRVHRHRVEWKTKPPSRFSMPEFDKGIPLEPFDGKKNAPLMAIIRSHAPHALDQIKR